MVVLRTGVDVSRRLISVCSFSQVTAMCRVFQRFLFLVRADNADASFHLAPLVLHELVFLTYRFRRSICS